MSLHGFGGVLPWARRAIVEEKRLMSPQEFNDTFAVSQVLPGANVVNLAIIFGARLHCAAGAAVATPPPFLPATGAGTSMRCSACFQASRPRRPG